MPNEVVMIIAVVVAVVTFMVTQISEDSYIADHCQHSGQAKVGSKWIKCEVLP